MVWDYVSDNPRKFTHWPSPFANMVKKLDVIACEHTWQARMEFWTKTAAEFFFTSFVPSPVELTRKFVLGSYKCGFYLPIKVKSPLDIIWRGTKPAVFYGELARPLTTGLFYFWAASTIFEGLNTWTSGIYRGEFCDIDGNETLLRDGHGTFPTGSGFRSGSAALFQVMYDPQNRYDGSGGTILVAQPSSTNVNAFGFIETNASTLTNVQVGIKIGGVVKGLVGVGTCLPFTRTPWEASWREGPFAGPVLTYFQCDSDGALGTANDFQCTRFTVSAVPSDEPIAPGGLQAQDTPPYKCGKVYEALYPIAVG